MLLLTSVTRLLVFLRLLEPLEEKSSEPLIELFVSIEFKFFENPY